VVNVVVFFVLSVTPKKVVNFLEEKCTHPGENPGYTYP